MSDETSGSTAGGTTTLDPTVELRNFIGGEWVEAGGAERIEIVNPATEGVISVAPSSTTEDVDQAVAAARSAAPGWGEKTPQERAEALFAVADAVDADSEELVRLESANVGKPLTMARWEIPYVSDMLRFMAGAARCLPAGAAGEYEAGHTSLIRREPLGAVGGIAPWNYPLMMAVWKIAPALAAGNAIVIKPSDETPLTLMRFAELAAPYLPAGVLNVVSGYGEPVGAAIAAHPGLAMVSLTGSPETGRRVAAAAAEVPKRVHLELGGKAPVVIFPDADLEAAVETVRVCGYFNAGQECAAAARVLVHSSIRDAFLEALSEAVAAMKVDDPAGDPDIDMGPVISRRQHERVMGFLERAAADGAVTVRGGAALDRPGFFIEPTIITEVEQKSEIIQREVFGPVVTVQAFAEEGDAIAMANDVPYGLSASVWTQDAARALRVSRALDFGTVWLNDHLAISNELPWGGFNQSGYGKEMSQLALDEYTRVKHVMLKFD